MSLFMPLPLSLNGGKTKGKTRGKAKETKAVLKESGRTLMESISRCKACRQL
jgi:hypothetical protein